MKTDYLSDRLFGRPARLRVAAWVMSHGGEIFYQAEVSRQIRTPPNVVMQELARLEELGMVKREATKRPRPTNLKNLTKVDSPVWRVIEEAIRAADES